MTSFFRQVSILSVSLAAFAISSSTLLATPILWSTASGGNGHYYEAISAPNGITWSDANAAATAQDGYLATITSAAENDFVYSLIEGDDFWHASGGGSYVGPWIGGLQPDSSQEPDGNWQWVTGEIFSNYNNWGPEQPNNVDGNEDRIQFYGPNNVKSSLWNDLPGEAAPSNWYVKGYVIESVPEPSTIALLLLGSFSLLFSSRRRRLA